MGDSVESRRLRQYEALLETYRHHVEVYSKLTALYLAMTGAVAGLVFATGTTDGQRTALLKFLILVSVASVVANTFVVFWGNSFQTVLNEIAGSLGLERISLLAARALVVLVIVMACIVAVTGIVLLV